uniref:Uncharacterized protein n=1 Tax=Hyaloperonospora arabidopsidis (strain Emoy2) TaxID=559515 RepID=M4BZ97_HYAAE
MTVSLRSSAAIPYRPSTRHAQLFLRTSCITLSPTLPLLLSLSLLLHSLFSRRLLGLIGLVNLAAFMKHEFNPRHGFLDLCPSRRVHHGQVLGTTVLQFREQRIALFQQHEPELVQVLRALFAQHPRFPVPTDDHLLGADTGGHFRETARLCTFLKNLLHGEEVLESATDRLSGVNTQATKETPELVRRHCMGLGTICHGQMSGGGQPKYELRGMGDLILA